MVNHKTGMQNYTLIAFYFTIKVKNMQFCVVCCPCNISTLLKPTASGCCRFVIFLLIYYVFLKIIKPRPNVIAFFVYCWTSNSVKLRVLLPSTKY